MTGTDSAREDARRPSGKFGAQTQGAPEVHLSAAEQLWQLDVVYNDGAAESISVLASGKLPAPHRSDSRVLTNLVGFRMKPFSPEVDLSLAFALGSPEKIVGMHPVFDTTEGYPTTVLGSVTGFAPAV